MIVKTDGIIIRETPQRDNDKFLTILTPERGKISVYANGVRSIKSPFLNTTQLLCYDEFVITEKGGKLWLKEAALIERFDVIRESIELFALAQYFLEVTNDVCMEGQEEPDMYNLILNILVLMCKKSLSEEQIRGVFELRTALYNGFMPELSSCGRCGKRLTHEMFTLPPDGRAVGEEGYIYFDVMNGIIRCRECFMREHEFERNISGEYDPLMSTVISTLSESVYMAVRYVFQAPANRIHAFKLDEKLVPEFSCFCEKYLLNHLERGFKTLDFYKTLINTRPPTERIS